MTKLKIENDLINNYREVGNMSPGDFFLYDGRLYLVVHHSYDKTECFNFNEKQKKSFDLKLSVSMLDNVTLKFS